MWCEVWLHLLQMATIGSKARQFWQHPAGPKTIHFWAPTFKWGISIANVADFKRPVEQVSYPQQIAVTATGIIWSRFATQITPVSALLYTSLPALKDSIETTLFEIPVYCLVAVA